MQCLLENAEKALTKDLNVHLRASLDEILGGTTSNIQRYGRINISSAGVISDAKRNGFLQQEYVPPRKKSSAKAQGIFHGLSEVLREAIVTRKKNNDAIQLQATAQKDEG